ncbi:hypothetical protein [Paenibacillus ginsengarvi]|uniref:hypothetical protein n=1 Tax=Paenibacillus ginsengarvi TaxID=400777 RepID=UPI00131524D9|nr:hypothetical protein [Paenibacillus ginsengarvi]
MAPNEPGPVRLTWTQAAQTVYGILRYTDKKDVFSMADVMGYSGHAFRITIHRETVSPAAPTVYSPYDLMGRTFEWFGFHVEKIGIPTPASPEQLGQFITFIQTSIDAGIPVAGWDLFVPEFGIIYGYDHERQEIYARDTEKDGVIKYSDLNNRKYNFLHATAISDSRPIDLLTVLGQSLERAISFSKGKYQKPDHEPFRNGLDGYDAWIEAFEGGNINIPGNAYNLAVIADAREFAVRFFDSFREKWTGQSALVRRLLPLAHQAALQYGKVADALGEMRSMFPFPHGGEPNQRDQAERAIDLIRAAQAEEIRGIEVMERMLTLLEEEQHADRSICN